MVDYASLPCTKVKTSTILPIYCTFLIVNLFNRILPSQLYMEYNTYIYI